jgi:hypothetical protein
MLDNSRYDNGDTHYWLCLDVRRARVHVRFVCGCRWAYATIANSPENQGISEPTDRILRRNRALRQVGFGLLVERKQERLEEPLFFVCPLP